MNKQELNRKRAEWAGFKVNWNNQLGATWEYPDESNQWFPLDFTQSLDACFKWLVPKAIDETMKEQECSSDVAYAILFKKWLQELELIIPDAALALCLAIDKLINEGKKEQ